MYLRHRLCYATRKTTTLYSFEQRFFLMDSSFSMLVVASRLPRPVGKGDSMTVYHLVKYMAHQGHRIHLVTFDGVDPFESAPRQDVLQELRSWCATVDLIPFNHTVSRLRALRGFFSREPLQAWYFRYPAMQAAVQRIAEEHRPEVLYAHTFRTAQYLWDYDEAPTVSGLMISYALNYKRMSRFIEPLTKRLFYAFEHRRLRTYEAKVLAAYDRALLISPQDKAAIHQHEQFSNVFFNPHGIGVEYFGEDMEVDPVPHSIIMTGDFGYPPNWDGALYFYQDVFPIIREQVPEAQLWLVGREPVQAILDLQEDPAVTVTGWVDDLRTYLQRASVSIVPIRIAAGMQNKIVVSMASGVPVVATPAANEGIRGRADEEIVLADEPAAFAGAVVRLLNDPAERTRIARNARRFVQEQWTWEYHFAQLEQMLRRLIDDGPEAPIEQYIIPREEVVQ